MKRDRADDGFESPWIDWIFFQATFSTAQVADETATISLTLFFVYTGSVTPKPIPKDTPDVILQAVGGEKILIIDREDSEVLNLCPWFATDKINSTGIE